MNSLTSDPMRILLLADAQSSHTYKWASSLKERGTDVAVFCLSRPEDYDYRELGIPVYCPFPFGKTVYRASVLRKAQFVRVVPALKKTLREFAPGILHAHYASSYGLLGALSGFHPYLVSVWGYDVFEFPEKSFLARAILRYNLRKADGVFSTSHIMAEQTRSYTRHPVKVVPFGIDTGIFRKEKENRRSPGDPLVIGTIKTLEPKYGIVYLVRAFDLLRRNYPELPLRLLIVGGGSQEKELRKLSDDLGIGNRVTITGRVPYREIPPYYRKLDIYAALSVASESFGVAVLEASATGIPVVVSDRGGLPEVVEDGVTGFVVPAENSEKAAEALEKLVRSEDLRNRMGAAGRSRVQNLFEWSACVDKMMEIYHGYEDHADHPVL